MEQSGFSHHLAKLKQQDNLLQKIEQLEKQKEEGAREICDLRAQKEILKQQLKQQDNLLQKIEQLEKQKEEGAREICDLRAQKEILKQQLKQQDKLLQKIEQLKKQNEEGAREIRDLRAQKEILVKRQEEIRCLDLQKKILIEKMPEKDKKVVEKGKKDEEDEVKKEDEEGEKEEEVKKEEEGEKVEEVKEEEKQKPKHSKGKGKNKSKNKGGRKKQGQSSGINEKVEEVEEVEGSMEDVKPSRVDIKNLEVDMQHVYVWGKIESVTFKREKGQQFAIGRISDNSGEVDFKATGTDVTKLRTGSFFKLGNVTAKRVDESLKLVSSGEIEEIPPIQVLISELTPNMENIYVCGKVIHVTLRHEGLPVAEGRLADKTGVVDFKVVGKKSAQIIKAESFFRFANIITEMDNGRMRVRILGGGITKLDIDPSTAAGFATNVTNDLSHPGRVFLP